MVKFNVSERKNNDYSRIIAELVGTFNCLTISEIKVFFPDLEKNQLKMLLQNLVDRKHIFSKKDNGETYYCTLGKEERTKGLNKALSFLGWLFSQKDKGRNTYLDGCEWIACSNNSCSSSLFYMSLYGKIYEILYVNSKNTKGNIQNIKVADQLATNHKCDLSCDRFVIIDNDVDLDPVDIRNVVYYIAVDNQLSIQKITKGAA